MALQATEKTETHWISSTLALPWASLKWRAHVSFLNHHVQRVSRFELIMMAHWSNMTLWHPFARWAGWYCYFINQALLRGYCKSKMTIYQDRHHDLKRNHNHFTFAWMWVSFIHIGFKPYPMQVIWSVVWVIVQELVMNMCPHFPNPWIYILNPNHVRP